MNLPPKYRIIVPQTAEGYRGAFFGMLLSLIVNVSGTTTGIAILISFAIGITFGPHLDQLNQTEESDLESASVKRRQFFDRN